MTASNDDTLGENPRLDYAVRNAAIEAIIMEWTIARDEKCTIQQQRTRLVEREREIEARMADCQAAARLFGISDRLLNLPDPSAPQNLTAIAVRTWKKWFPRNGTQPAYAPVNAIAQHHEIVAPPEDIMDADFLAADERITEAVAQLKALSESTPRPATRDIVLEQLKAAGEAGARAAQIQIYIETNYAEKIHAKTVSMALNRLQREGLVRREGHNWFFTPQNTETVSTALAVNGTHLDGLEARRC